MRITIHPTTEGVLNDDAYSTVRRTVLPSGVRVLTEQMPGVRSVTIGYWIAVGSRDEADHQYGSTHFLEHLLFKGTRTRSALDIAAAFDTVGGESNAMTGKESTCYYARVLDTDLPMAAEVLTDLVTSAVIDPDEMETERGVILEELAMDEDDPTDVVHERFSEQVLSGHPLGYPSAAPPKRSSPHPATTSSTTTGAGTGPRSWSSPPPGASTTTSWSAWSPRRSRPATGTSAAAESPQPAEWGRADHPGGRRSGQAPQEHRAVTGDHRRPRARRRRRGPLRPVADARHPRGGMSSRLFQEVRERRGLAYNTYSFSAPYTDA